MNRTASSGSDNKQPMVHAERDQPAVDCCPEAVNDELQRSSRTALKQHMLNIH
jgi:hypothetical protein